MKVFHLAVQINEMQLMGSNRSNDYRVRVYNAIARSIMVIWRARAFKKGFRDGLGS